MSATIWEATGLLRSRALSASTTDIPGMISVRRNAASTCGLGASPPTSSSSSSSAPRPRRLQQRVLGDGGRAAPDPAAAADPDDDDDPAPPPPRATKCALAKRSHRNVSPPHALSTGAVSVLACIEKASK